MTSIIRTICDIALPMLQITKEFQLYRKYLYKFSVLFAGEFKKKKDKCRPVDCRFLIQYQTKIRNKTMAQ